MNEEQIVEKASSGDKRAFEELFKLYEQKIYNLTLRWTGDPNDALDASQEIFLRVYKYLPGFKKQSSFSTWIYRIAVNVCHDFYVSSNNEIISIDDDDTDYQNFIPDIRYSPENEFERRLVREALKEGILSLDEKQKAIIIMRDIEGLSYDKIAEILDINSGTVKSRIARAREKLRRKLAENGNFSESRVSNKQGKEE